MITMHHFQVPAHDKEASARQFAAIFGLRYHGPEAHLARVRINDHLVMDFATKDDFHTLHYAFQVSEAEFDAVLGRMQEMGVVYGSEPRSKNMELNPRRGGRTLYYLDPNGHNFEILTA